VSSATVRRNAEVVYEVGRGVAVQAQVHRSDPMGFLGLVVLWLFSEFVLCRCSSIQNWLVMSRKAYMERLLFHSKLSRYGG